MTRWIRRSAALLCGLFPMAFLLPRGAHAAAIAAVVAGLLWSAADLLPPRVFGVVNTCAFLASTASTALLALQGSAEGWAVVASGVSLLAWNTGLFMLRWPEAPSDAERRYLASAAKLLLLGFSLGISTVAAAGVLSVPFPFAWLLMLTVCVALFGLLRGAR